MVQALTLAQANAIDTDIDLSKYEAVNSSTKTALHEAFKHILTTIDANFSATKQDAVYVTLEKKALIAKEKAFDVQLAKVTADAKNLIEVANAKSVELIATAQGELTLATQSIFKAEIEGKAKDAEIARLMEQLAVRDAEVASGRVTLAEVQGQYQRAVYNLSS
ncbi:MAG: hypothetical protein Q9M36_06825 [Sulfurovum sp.]|nr:hypothetical protein [Sulfurovum sp.]